MTGKLAITGNQSTTFGYKLCQRHLQHLSDVDRMAVRAVRDLMAAGGAVGDDEGVGTGLAYGGKQRKLGHRHRSVVVLGFVAEAARHATAARVDGLDGKLG